MLLLCTNYNVLPLQASGKDYITLTTLTNIYCEQSQLLFGSLLKISQFFKSAMWSHLDRRLPNSPDLTITINYRQQKVSYSRGINYMFSAAEYEGTVGGRATFELRCSPIHQMFPSCFPSWKRNVFCWGSTRHTEKRNLAEARWKWRDCSFRASV